MRSITTRLGLVAVFAAAFCIFTPLSPAQATPGQVQVTIRDEARLPIVDANIEVSCNGTVFASLGSTSATGTVIGDPTVGTTCENGSNLQFRVSSSTFATQHYPIYNYTLLPFYTRIDPQDASSTISGSTNTYTFGVETTSTYAVNIWNAGGDASLLPFPTRMPDYTTSSSILAYNWGDAAPGFPGIGTYDWFIQATKTVTLDTGWYEFDAGSDDGMIVALDGTTIIDDYTLQALQTVPNTKRIFVTAGAHTIDIKYYEHEGVASLYFSFYPIDTPHAPIIDIGTPVASPLNNRLAPSLGIHTDTAGLLTYSGGCTSTGSISIGVGTSTVSMAQLANGTYSSCRLTVTDPDTGYASEIAIPSFTVAAPVPQHISSCEQLQALRSVSTNYAEDFILDDDIDCDEVSLRPLTWGGHPYIGTFDGNGHTISNFVMSRFDAYTGLFGNINGGTVKDLTFGTGSIQQGFGIGAIAGYATNATLTNISSNLDIEGDPGFYGNGGLIGRAVFSNGSTTTWSNVTVNGTVSGMQDTGGLIGTVSVQYDSTFVIDNAHITGAISPGRFEPSISRGGGLIGNANVYATGTLAITNSSVSSSISLGDSGTQGGGFIGYLLADTSGTATVTISNSSTTGSVTGTQDIGGFIGSLSTFDEGSTHTIDINHNQSSMTVTGQTTNVGGFIGVLSNTFGGAVHSTILLDANSATGDVTGDGNVGGFLGGTDGSGAGTYIQHANGTGGLTISNNTASGQVTGNNNSDDALNAGGFIGLLSCKSNNTQQFAACTIRQNSASGNVQGFRYVGGFMGQLDGDINVEDNYSIGNVTGARDTGGFLGTLNSEFSYANVSHVYASSTVTTSGGSPLYVAGFIGSAQTSNSNTTIDDAFAIVSLVDPSDVGELGWMMGNLVDITPRNLSYHAVSGPTSSCIQSNSSASFCTARAEESYFFRTSNSPLNAWDFTRVWQYHTNGYPTLRSDAIIVDTTSPEISALIVDPSATAVHLSWTTDEPASTDVLYSLDTSYDSSAGVRDTSPRSTSHSVTIFSLTPCQTYHFRVVSADRFGNTNTTAGATFTTVGCSGGGSSGSGGGGGGGSSRSVVIIGQPIQPPAPSNGSSTLPIASAPANPVTVTRPGGSGSAASDRRCVGYTFTKNLTLRSTHADVKQLQIFLNQNGSLIATSGPGSMGNETTFFGPVTKQALMKFQRAHALPVDGIFASTTRTYIQNHMPTAVCPTTQIFNRTLRLKMNGADVKILQRFLKVSETGFFGIQTQNALKAFQQRQNLVPSGTLDPASRTLLNTIVAS